MALDVLTRWLFADGGISAGLAGVNAKIAQFGAASPGARQGLRGIEIGMRQAAFAAVGLQGAAGQAARGLLQFGGGSALVLGVAAGIGLVGGAYQLATKNTRELADEHKRLEAAFRTAIVGADPQVKAAQAYRDALKEVEKQEASLAAARQRAAPILQGGQGIISARGEVTQAEENVALARGAAILASPESRGRAAVRAAERQLELVGLTAGEVAARKLQEEDVSQELANQVGLLTDQLPIAQQLFAIRQRAALDLQGIAGRAALGFAGEGAVGIPGFDAAALQRSIARDVRMTPGDIQEQAGRARGLQVGEDPRSAAFAARQAELNGILAASAPRAQVLASQMALLEQEIDRLGAAGGDTSQLQFALEHLRQEMGRTGKAATVSAQQFITAGFGLATALVSGGSPGGILAGIGGIAGLIPGGGTIGAVLGGLGGLFGAMDSNEDRRHRELLTTINQSADRIRGGPQRVTLVLVTPEGERIDEVEYELGRRTRRDAVVRLPAR